MLQTPEKLLTLRKFLTLPETEPASEYVNGKAMTVTVENVFSWLLE